MMNDRLAKIYLDAYVKADAIRKVKGRAYIWRSWKFVGVYFVTASIVLEQGIAKYWVKIGEVGCNDYSN